MAVGLEKVIRETVEKTGFDIQIFASDPKFKQYIDVQKYIRRFLDHFRVDYDKESVTTSLQLFYLWLKVVDDKLDRSARSGSFFIDRFGNMGYIGNKEDKLPPSVILTDTLREMTMPQHQQVLEALVDLYSAVTLERNSTNMAEFIKRRKKTGRYTALTTLQIISPYIERNSSFEKFLLRLGEVGQLIDSVVDLGRDIKNGELSFQPNFADRALLYGTALKDGIGMFISYPFLYSNVFTFAFGVVKNGFR